MGERRQRSREFRVGWGGVGGGEMGSGSRLVWMGSVTRTAFRYLDERFASLWIGKT